METRIERPVAESAHILNHHRLAQEGPLQMKAQFVQTCAHDAQHVDRLHFTLPNTAEHAYDDGPHVRNDAASPRERNVRLCSVTHECSTPVDPIDLILRQIYGRGGKRNFFIRSASKQAERSDQESRYRLHRSPASSRIRDQVAEGRLRWKLVAIAGSSLPALTQSKVADRLPPALPR